MNKKAINIVKVILALFAPSAIFIGISAVLMFELGPFIPMIALLSAFFAGEVMAVQRGESFMWAAVSKTSRDKIVFAACLISFWSIVLFPIFLKVELWYLNLAFIALAFLIVVTIVALFASKTMKEDLLSKRLR